MGRDISYRNNATFCVNRLEESVRVFSLGHVSILGFHQPCRIQQIHRDFRIKSTRLKKALILGSDLTKVKCWCESIEYLAAGAFLFAFSRPIVLQTPREAQY